MPQFLIFLILALPLVGAYAMYAIGIVAIYQSSRVLNLAHGALATIPAYALYTLVVLWGVPRWIAIPFSIALGAALGFGVERIFVRRLRSISPTAQTIGTVAAFGFLISLAAKIWGTAGLRAVPVFPDGHIGVGASNLRFGQLGLFAVAIVLTIIMTVYLRKTWFGLAMRASAENRLAASVVGINPELTSGVAWALGGALAASAGILLSAVTILHPYSLSLSVLPAFVAALIGGLERLPGAVVGSAIVGVAIGVVPLLADVPFLSVLGHVGGAELTLTIAAMVVMAFRGTAPTGEIQGLVAGWGSRLQIRKRIRIGRTTTAILVLIGIGWVWLPGLRSSVVADASKALLYTMVAASLVLLTGWVGQISLAQAAFVGIGAFGSVLISNSLGLPFPLGIPLAGALAAVGAMGLGIVALRVRGLYLAVATLIFGWMADQYLFSSPWFAGVGGSATMPVEPIGIKGGFPYFDFDDRRIFYLVVLAATAITLLLLSNIRRSKTGRAFFAIRGSEKAAASLGIDITRYKLLAFGVSGFIAGVAGSLVAAEQQTIVPASFAFTVSLFFLSVAVVGGIESLGGVLGAASLFAVLNQLFLRVEFLHGWLDVVSATLLVSVLLFYPGGFGAIPAAYSRISAQLKQRQASRIRSISKMSRWTILRSRIRDVEDAVLLSPIVRGIRSRLGPKGTLAPSAEGDRSILAVDTAHSLSAITSMQVPADSNPEPLLDVSRLTVSFGGLLAIDNVSLTIRAGEIAGLVGPNGAGKTTVFNAVAGFVSPASGVISVRGNNVARLSVNERAALGIGRTFQLVQVFPQLSVFDNLMVASHLADPTSFPSHLIASTRSARAEAASRLRVQDVLWLTGLDRLRDSPVAGLPLGTLRILELARAIVMGADLIMLDEPASGLDPEETDRLSELLRRTRTERGTTLFVIEHDVRMIMSLCDRIHVLDRGRLIAEGSPEAVRQDPVVVAAFLGPSYGQVAVI